MQLTNRGISPPISKSSRLRSTPTRPAIARRCTTAFVEPPTAALARIAFSNASLVKISDGFRSSSTISTIRLPVICASAMRRASTAGRAALVGRDMPIASTSDAIVLAVPIVIHTPLLRDIPDSAFMKSCKVISPARTASENFHTSVPEPMSEPLYFPFSIGPEDTTIEGRSTDAAPINWPGVVLSQPPSNTTPSMP